MIERSDTKRSSMAEMFKNNNNLTGFSAEDTPDLSEVTDMSFMFNGATKFEGNLNNRDVSNIENMEGLFYAANGVFNKDISSWNVENVTNMNYMFAGSNFNQDISSWNVHNVEHMSFMFWLAEFNQDISSRCVPKITSKPA